MKKIANFLVEKRYIILATMLVLAVGCGILTQKVNINSDMTKYLPDDSSMKAGLDIMDKEFPATEDSGDIRVMFNGLEDSQKAEVLKKLKSIEYVDSVNYKADSADYNNGEHTLYIVNFNYGYGSDEAAVVEDTISSGFNNYDMVYHVDNDSKSLPSYIVIIAVTLLMTILFLMCASWLEPILLLATIGVAIVINMGTNAFLGTVSQTTYSIASILQLVLSMDYAMILINRYRQELALEENPKAAMKNALANAFSAIISSAGATMVGLLMLCFMRFKIGMDLGIVLAKGVLISMLCILTILSSLLVIGYKGIRKTAKKVLPIKMDAIGKFSNKFRFAVTGVFVLIFVGALLLSSNTKMAYVLAGEDPTEEYFPKDSKIVVLYNNSDEATATELAAQYSSNPDVKDAQSFATTLGKEYTSEELADKLADMGDNSNLNINSALLDIIYYDYYKGDTTGSISVSDFINFLANDVMTNETFANQFDDNIKNNIETMKKFVDPDNLTSQMNAEEIAAFFGMDSKDITKLFMYYYIKNGGVDTGTMTLAQFADFIVNDVAANKDYSSMFDKDTFSKINQLSVFTDKDTVTKPLDSTELASMIGMDESTVKLLLVYYYATQDGFDAGTMTVSQFVNFLTKDVASNKMFASYFDSTTLAKMQTLAQYTNTAVIQKQMTSKELASALSMDSSMIDQIFNMYFSAKGATVDWTMTLPEFTDFLAGSVLTNKAYASYFNESTTAQLTSLNQMIRIAASGRQLSSAELAAFTGMDSSMIDQLFQYASSTSGSNITGMSLTDFLGFVLNDVSQNENFSSYFDEKTLASLSTTYTLAQAASSGQKFTSSQLAGYLSMDSALTSQIFYMYYNATGKTSGWTMSMQEFVDFLLKNVVTNEQYSSNFNTATIGQLKLMQSIMNATTSGKSFNCNKMAELFSMDSSMVKMLYTYYIAENGDTSGWNISLQSMISFIVNNLSSRSEFSSMFDRDTLNKLDMLQKLINGTVAGTVYTSAQLSSLLGMDAEQLNQLYLLYNSEYGDTSSWKMSVQGFVNFIISDVLNNKDFSDSFDADTVDKLKNAKIMIDASVSGNIYTSKELADIFSSFSDKLNQKTMNLLYLYYFSTTDSDPAWKLSIYDLFNYLSSNILNDSRFDEFIDNDMRANMDDMKTKLDDGVKQLTGPNYSRLILTVSLQDGSDEANAFIEELSKKCEAAFGGDYYLIGNSPMSYEMSQTFDGEHHFITILTAIAIFIVVALTFQSFLIPLILVLIIQGGVYLTISIIGLQGNSIFYLALLIVECILMGATIDYGILFASYYKEFRTSMGRGEALIAAYNGSIHTILTSGLIMVLVTGIVGGAFKNPTVGQICMTISKGALCAVILIVFILPGVIATFDKLINRRNKVK